MSKHKNLGTIEKLMDGFNPYRQRQEETRGLVKKWEPTGLLEGIEDEQKRIPVLLIHQRFFLPMVKQRQTIPQN